MVLGDVLEPFVFSFPGDWLSSDIIPENFMILSAYPNPFNPIINIEYQIEEGSPIEFLFYDILGNKVDYINKGYMPNGAYQLLWENNSLPSGAYFIVMSNGIKKHIKKVLLIK